MITVIRDGHAVDIPARELTDADAHAVTVALAAEGIRVEPVVDPAHVVHLWAKTPVTTSQEVHVLAAFKAVTDCRLAFHPVAAR